MNISYITKILYLSYYRINTVEVSWRYEFREVTMNIVRDRWLAENSLGSLQMFPQEHDREKMFRIQSHVWWRKPDAWREEKTSSSRDHKWIISYIGDHYWSFVSEANKLYTNKTPFEGWQGNYQVEIANRVPLEDHIVRISLFDPSFLLMTHELEVTGNTVHAGREAVAVRAVYRKNKQQLAEDMFWAGADEYHLLVDQEYGILLRYGAILDGEEFAVSSVDSVIYNEPISDEVFQFSPG
jgi:outer membrane lipoprotein-sorting protein